MEGRRESLDYVNEVNFHGLQLSGLRAINSQYAIATCMNNYEKEKKMFMIVTQHYKTYNAKVFTNPVGQSFQVSKNLPQAYVEIHLGGMLSSSNRHVDVPLYIALARRYLTFSTSPLPYFLMQHRAGFCFQLTRLLKYPKIYLLLILYEIKIVFIK
jgi:hypothetical protein